MTRLIWSRAARSLLALVVCADVASSDARCANLVNGYRRYNAACNHCHGPDGVGSTFAPSLVDQIFDLETFRQVVLVGKARDASVMKGFADDANIAPYVDDIFVYLKARAERAIGRGRPHPPP
jgi:mono/diheme cytochrome c family protein